MHRATPLVAAAALLAGFAVAHVTPTTALLARADTTISPGRRGDPTPPPGSGVSASAAAQRYDCVGYNTDEGPHPEAQIAIFNYASDDADGLLFWLNDNGDNVGASIDVTVAPQEIHRYTTTAPHVARAFLRLNTKNIVVDGRMNLDNTTDLSMVQVTCARR
ncbi:MAG: hypothetical protein IT307_14520 [Chloroflexi bacterium]|nr:hypothetical protein [Chloroflexota bacterium]